MWLKFAGRSSRFWKLSQISIATSIAIFSFANDVAVLFAQRIANSYIFIHWLPNVMPRIRFHFICQSVIAKTTPYGKIFSFVPKKGECQ